MNKFKLGDIVVSMVMFDDDELVITAKEDGYYRAKFISGWRDGQVTYLARPSNHIKIGNIFDKKRSKLWKRN